MSKVTFARETAAALRSAETVVFCAPEKTFASGWVGRVVDAPWAELVAAALKDTRPGRNGGIATVYTGVASPKKVIVAVLPNDVSRHNSPIRHEAIASCIGRAGITDAKKAAVILGLDEADHYLGAANAVGRALPSFTRKKGRKTTKGNVVIAATDKDGERIAATNWVTETMHAARWAADAVDTPTADLTTAGFARSARKLIKGLDRVRVTEIVGDKLLEKNLNGIHAVGRTAVVPPRLLIFDYNPTDANKTYALIGKGVVYDTGGLSLKASTYMRSMKGDMGGGAATVGAFRALVACGFPHRLIAAIPLAENAIGPNAYRPDDIVVMHSGKSVEIDNTDAEGRLLLADALSYVCRKYKPVAAMEAATLTGAQLISSGLRHGSVVSNRDGFERVAVETGRASGDLAHALLFAPEFYQAEFASKVADMQNSVKDRMNAQSSCAAQFCYAHIDDLDTPWLHIDLAGPAWRGGRGTGFGVALMSQIYRRIKASDLKS